MHKVKRSPSVYVDTFKDDFICWNVWFQFEMLTGALPFQGANRKETMTQILK